MSVIRSFLAHIRATGRRRPQTVTTVSMGRERVFEAYDVGDDTFIFEKGVASHLAERPSVLIVEKSALRRKTRGMVMTLSTGNHAVAALPLLDGRFWKFSAVPASKRSATLSGRILCANIGGDTLEISQRDIPTETLVASDAWLVGKARLGLGEIVMAERNVATLEHYRSLGQEWRVKPLAWTDGEMRTALAASRKCIASVLRYFHSARGVHLLSYAEFARFAALAESDPAAFVKSLKELVSVYEGNEASFMRQLKYRGDHEIELFGLPRGVSIRRIVPELEKLMEMIALGRIGQLGMIQRIGEIAALYRSLLMRPTLSDEDSDDFIRTIYMYVTGEIYAVVGEGLTPAFDDRRTALPGATFADGRPILHPGADARTEILLSNLRSMMSKDEFVEYANVYELRGDDDSLALGKGATREVVYKTNRRPLENSLVEKRLSHSSCGYSCYMLSRIGALRALGIRLSEHYQLLKRRVGSASGQTDYYIRSRCEGDPIDSIPTSCFRGDGDASAESKEVVLALAALMGDAAAQNLAMKKYDPKRESPLYGVGKEIYAFEYDIAAGRLLPKRVSICSIRSSFGWPSVERTDSNFKAMVNFYFGHYVHALKAYQRQHPSVKMAEVAGRFVDGFAFRTQALSWQLRAMRDRFEAFDPEVPARYGFAKRWKFVLWSLEEQAHRLDELKDVFLKKAKVVENESLRNNPQ